MKLQYPLNAHESKYQTLAETLGIEHLKSLIPVNRERIQAALKAGDIHLNTIPLIQWDKASLGKHYTKPKFFEPADWPGNDLRWSAWDLSLPWYKIPTLSLAERVCILKHVAIYHYI